MTRVAEPTRTGLPRSVIWGYGGGEWANSVVWTAFSALFLYYLTDVVHGSAAFGGTLMMAGTLWNTVLQPYVGICSDRLRSPLGRRRPFLLAAALPYGVTSWLLFTDPGLHGAAQLTYYSVIVMAWFTSLTVFYVPYSALCAELSQDPAERTTLSSFRTAFSQLGALAGAVSPLALSGLFTSDFSGNSRAGWSAAGAVCALLATAGLLTAWRTTRGHERPAVDEAAPRWRDSFTMLRSRSVRLMLGMQAFGWAPLSVIGAVAVYYGIHLMGYSQDRASLVVLCWFVAGLAWLPLVQYVTNRIGKKRSYLAFMSMWAVLQSLFLFAGRTDVVLFWGLILTSSAGSMAVAVIGWSMLADLTDVEHYRTGQRREGALNGMAALAQTGLAAFALWLVGIALSAAGYHGGQQPGTAAALTIRILMSAGAAVWIIPALICCLRYPVTAERHQAIVSSLHTGEGDPAILLRRL